MPVRVQTEDFDLGAEILAFRLGNTKIGAVASFIGLVRDMNHGTTVSEMTLEHYPGMTEKALTEIVEEATQRWNIIDALVIHRIALCRAAGVAAGVRRVAGRQRSQAKRRQQLVLDPVHDPARAVADDERYGQSADGQHLVRAYRRVHDAATASQLHSGSAKSRNRSVT